MTKTITGNAVAWIAGGQRLRDEPNNLVSELAYALPHQDMSTCGWIEYGNAVITITPRDKTEVVTEQIEQLRKDQASILAKAEAESTRINQQIQSLLAIWYEATQEAAEEYQIRRDEKAMG